MSSKLLTRGGFAYPGTSMQFKTGTWRVQRPVHHPLSAPCHCACPAGENPQAYIAKVDQGDLRGAWETLVQANPLPAVTGRVCPHPCENSCNRGEYDTPLAIHSIERFLGDRAIAEQWEYPVSPPAADAVRVAIIGAGPAGLSCAYHMTRLGFQVTLFTAVPEAGGTLHAIPGYRLPPGIISAETQRILDIGIDFRPNHRLGRDIHLSDLRQEYAAVFIAVGTQLAREWSVGGVTPRDLHVGLNVLKEWMAVGSVPMSKSAAVVGGGNTSVDLSRILKRAGIPEVHLVTHNGIPGMDSDPEDMMRAVPREIAQAQEEGVIIHPHRGIRRLILRGERVVGVEMVHMKKIPDQNGQLKRVSFEGTETVLHVEQVIPAIGQIINPAGLETLLEGKHFLSVDTSGKISGHDSLFAGGDVRAGGDGTVTAAVGDGRRAAEAMARFIQGESSYQAPDCKPIRFSQLNINYFEPAPRNEEPTLPVAQRSGEEEIEGSLSHAQVAAEARRCFSCGSCMACDNCWTLCPDSAVLKSSHHTDEDPGYHFDYDYCKGCGLCAHECPCGYIEMVDDL